MIISQKGIDLIKHYESFKSKAYICPTGHLTIGYGTIIDTKGENYLRTATLSEPEAESLLRMEVKYYQSEVMKLIKLVNQNQFDALISFAFNCGITNLKNSTLLKIINQDPNSEKIEAEFKKWCHGNGEVLPGLQKRRASESYLYLHGQLKFY